MEPPDFIAGCIPPQVLPVGDIVYRGETGTRDRDSQVQGRDHTTVGSLSLLQLLHTRAGSFKRMNEHGLSTPTSPAFQ